MVNSFLSVIAGIYLTQNAVGFAWNITQLLSVTIGERLPQGEHPSILLVAIISSFCFVCLFSFLF